MSPRHVAFAALCLCLGCDESSDADGRCDDAECFDDDAGPVANAEAPGGVLVVVRTPPEVEDASDAAEAVLQRTVGKGNWDKHEESAQAWGVELENNASLWLLTPKTYEIDRMTAAGVNWDARLWRMAERLRDDAWVSADARTRPVTGDDRDIPFIADGPRASDGRHAIDDPQWHLAQGWGIDAHGAWQRFAGRGISPGQGVTIAHPDTGYLPHVELGFTPAATGCIDTLREMGCFRSDGRVRWSDALSTQPGSNSAGVDTGGALLSNEGHGTRTASLLISREGSEGSLGRKGATGVVPYATLVPLRVGAQVTIADANKGALVDAIEEGIAAQADVFSISMGGEYVWDRPVRDALTRAAQSGALVFAAAGNVVQFLEVVEPASHPEAFAVAASNAWGEPWASSNRGAKVDISAPGEDVVHGSPGFIDGEAFDTAQAGGGTSFSTALAAGVGALWISFHGRETLHAQYCENDDCSAIPAAFLHVIQTAGHNTPSGWDTARMGPGIIDARRTLDAPLPTMCRDEAARFGWTAC